ATGTATAAAALPLPREVDDDGTAVEHGAVHRVNRCLCCLLRGIFDEAKASRLPAHTVDDHGRRHHVTEAGKCLAKLVIHGRKRQIPHVQSCVHYLQSSFAPDLAVRTKPGARGAVVRCPKRGEQTEPDSNGSTGRAAYLTAGPGD